MFAGGSFRIRCLAKLIDLRFVNAELTVFLPYIGETRDAAHVCTLGQNVSIDKDRVSNEGSRYGDHRPPLV